MLQILLLQACYYTGISTLLLFTALSVGTPFAVEQLLDWRTIRGDTAMGWTIGVGVWGMGGSLAGTVALVVVVARSKLVLDFVLTLHALHWALTAAYTRALPRNVLWWALQVGSVAVMAVGGVWSCRWRELRPMSFGSAAGKELSAQGRGEYEMLAQAEDGRVREGRG